MKRIITLVFLFAIISQHAFTQKLYVWCQKEQIATPRNGFLENKVIDLVVFDARIMTPKSKIECSSETITNNLALLIKSTYPSAKKIC